MTPVLVSVDQAGDLKIGRKKCRLYKKDEVVKVAKKYGISTEKKTVKELCGAIRARANNSPQNMNKKALDKKVAANFMKGMVTKNSNIAKLRQLNENTPKSAKNTQNVNKTQKPKKMNKADLKKIQALVKEELKKMQALIKKLDSQSKTKATEFRVKKQKLKELQQHLKTIKPFKGITQQVREFATQEFVEHWDIPMPDRFTDARDLISRGYYRGDPKKFYQNFIDRANPLIEEARVDVKKQIDGLQPKVDALESEVSELKNKITALKAEYKRKQRAISKPRAKPTAA